jgi:hypothetical protein
MWETHLNHASSESALKGYIQNGAQTNCSPFGE